MKEAQKISRKEEQALIQELFYKKREPYDVFLGEELLAKVLKSDFPLKRFRADDKYALTEKLRNLTLSIYTGKMKDAVKALQPEKKLLAKTYSDISWNYMCDALTEK
jgi:hypothetical protein